jgi:hypothetical protein
MHETILCTHVGPCTTVKITHVRLKSGIICKIDMNTWLRTPSYAHTTVSFCMLSAYSACHSSSAVSDASLQSGGMWLPQASVMTQQFMWMPNSL